MGQPRSMAADILTAAQRDPRSCALRSRVAHRRLVICEGRNIAFTNRSRTSLFRKVKGFLPPDSGSSGPQVERTDKTEVVKKPSSSGSIAGFPRGATSGKLVGASPAREPFSNQDCETWAARKGIRCRPESWVGCGNESQSLYMSE